MGARVESCWSVGYAICPFGRTKSEEKWYALILSTYGSNVLTTIKGLDISKAIGNRQLMFIDCMAELANQQRNSIFSTIEKAITEAVARLSQSEAKSNIFLILDNPDVHLATGSATAQQLCFLMLKLRISVHSVLLVCSADQPLLQPTISNSGLQITPLEIESSMFLTQQAHNARLVISVRELATGAAKDVSGVLRVTRSSGAYDTDEDAAGSKVDETEALYLVSRDGSVKVFQRGADAV